MNVQWGQIRPDRRLSFHEFRTFTRMPGVAVAVCGRRLDAATVVDDRPGNSRTCESCYQRRSVAEERAEEDPTMGVTLP